MDGKNPLGLDMVNRYLLPIWDKTCPEPAPPSLQAFDPDGSRVSIYHNQVVIDYLSLSPLKAYLE